MGRGNEATRHHDDAALAALVMAIATINVWNRLNVAIRQVGGAWTASAGGVNAPARCSSARCQSLSPGLIFRAEAIARSVAVEAA